MKHFYKSAKSVLALLFAITFLFFGTISFGNTDYGSSDNGSSDHSETISLPDFPSFPFPGIMPLDDWDCSECI